MAHQPQLGCPASRYTVTTLDQLQACSCSSYIYCPYDSCQHYHLAQRVPFLISTKLSFSCPHDPPSHLSRALERSFLPPAAVESPAAAPASRRRVSPLRETRQAVTNHLVAGCCSAAEVSAAVRRRRRGDGRRRYLDPDTRPRGAGSARALGHRDTPRIWAGGEGPSAGEGYGLHGGKAADRSTVVYGQRAECAWWLR